MKKLLALVVTIIGVFAVIGRLPSEVSKPADVVHGFTTTDIVDRTVTPKLVTTEQTVPKKKTVEPQELYRSLEQLFVKQLPTVVDPRQLRPQLLAINAQGNKAVQLMFVGLRSAKTPLTTRLAIVDYLRYRLRWDDDLSDLVLEYVTQETETNDQQFRALTMADKAELLGAIAKRDRLLARQVAETIDRPLFRNIISYEVYHALLEIGEDSATAQQFVRSFHGSFKL